MDECLPPIIRDNKYFMYPFYYYAYKGKDIKTAMNFKTLIYSLSEKEYRDFYENLNSISRQRDTDLNDASIKYIIDNLLKTAKNLIDIGCGNGYFLKQLKNNGLDLFGCDIADTRRDGDYNFVRCSIAYLPFRDKLFDIVTCSHTLEHILNPEKAISELKRITRKQLIITVPCQRYYLYTLDEHVHFFPYKEKLASLIGIKDSTCKKIRGDWVYIGYLESFD
jgi:ubiquinone/menaquinone biosynthesis C-methylase UbiE